MSCETVVSTTKIATKKKTIGKINNSRIYYLSHINKLVKDIMESYWPAGFLVKIISTNAYNEFICKLYYCYKRFKEK